MGLLKKCFCLLQLVLFCTGIGLIAVGGYVQYYVSYFDYFLDSPYLTMLPVMLIIIGIIVSLTLVCTLWFHTFDFDFWYNNKTKIRFSFMTLTSLMISAMLVVIITYGVSLNQMELN